LIPLRGTHCELDNVAVSSVAVHWGGRFFQLGVCKSDDLATTGR
jgi:hypothetical protein